MPLRQNNESCSGNNFQISIWLLFCTFFYCIYIKKYLKTISRMTRTSLTLYYIVIYEERNINFNLFRSEWGESEAKASRYIVMVLQWWHFNQPVLKLSSVCWHSRSPALLMFSGFHLVTCRDGKCYKPWTRRLHK